ncbi:GntR family transcriptional regulator [Mesorhizobium sp. M0114]|uniref:GntR family transcriptional regulator n=1 Tax=unclassified Mesorhizobium TaxID=325217 RepID=UPI0033394B84
MAAIARDKAESSYHRLKELVINYRFRPGEPLSPVSIADRLYVSATPVREALARLHGEDLVDLVPNRGFFAKTLNSKCMSDYYKFALQISISAIERGYTRFVIDQVSHSEITNAYIYGNHGKKRDEYLISHAKALERLYVQVVSLAGNQVMLDCIRKFNDQTHFVRLIDLEVESNFHEIAADMSALISALARQDVAAATANLQHQRDKKLARMNDLVKEGISRSLKES